MIDSAREVFYGSNGVRTTSYMRELEKQGHVGKVAAELFRAQKASTRGKYYRGGVRGGPSYRQLAYENTKNALRRLCELLQADSRGLRWGWGRKWAGYLQDVLYVDLPQGQVSFHSGLRFAGPDYPGRWDPTHPSSRCVIEFCDQVSGYTPERAASQAASLEVKLAQNRLPEA
jgi:hypothetical protein